jgi:hypothetical protein
MGLRLVDFPVRLAVLPKIGSIARRSNNATASQQTTTFNTPCGGQTLWAYNLGHLDFIEAFVTAELRERQPDDRYGWSNRSLFSRLPKWMQSAKNREQILKAIRASAQASANAKIRQSV